MGVSTEDEFVEAESEKEDIEEEFNLLVVVLLNWIYYATLTLG
jgi:hypothetical protein